MSYLLDTTVIIDHVGANRGALDLVRRLFEETGDLFTCDVITCEALSGGTQEQREDARVLLQALEYVAIDPEAARWAGARRLELGLTSRRGVGDALIAATAWRIGATVVTRNGADFERFGVPVLEY